MGHRPFFGFYFPHKSHAQEEPAHYNNRSAVFANLFSGTSALAGVKD